MQSHNNHPAIDLIEKQISQRSSQFIQHHQDSNTCSDHHYRSPTRSDSASSSPSPVGLAIESINNHQATSGLCRLHSEMMTLVPGGGQSGASSPDANHQHLANSSGASSSTSIDIRLIKHCAIHGPINNRLNDDKNNQNVTTNHHNKRHRDNKQNCAHNHCHSHYADNTQVKQIITPKSSSTSSSKHQDYHRSHVAKISQKQAPRQQNYENIHVKRYSNRPAAPVPAQPAIAGRLQTTGCATAANHTSHHLGQLDCQDDNRPNNQRHNHVDTQHDDCSHRRHRSQSDLNVARHRNHQALGGHKTQLSTTAQFNNSSQQPKTSATIIKFVSQIYFLIHLAVIISILLHHRMLIANEQQQTSDVTSSSMDNNNLRRAQRIDFRFKRSHLSEEQLSLQDANNNFTQRMLLAEEHEQQSITTSSNDILVRLFGYSHARKFLYYVLAYLLSTSAIILLLIRLVRYISTHHHVATTTPTATPGHLLQSCNTYPYFGMESSWLPSRSTFYHRLRLDCTPVLIACIALGLVQLTNIGYNVANKMDLFANQSRWPIYLAALHFCFVSLLTQYILGWVTTKHEQRRLLKALREQEQLRQRREKALRITQAAAAAARSRLTRPNKPINQFVVEPTSGDAIVSSPVISCSSSIDEEDDRQERDELVRDDILAGKRATTTIGVDNDHRRQVANNRTTTIGYEQQRDHPIRHGLHNIALAHILVTHLLLWLMDLNSIDLLLLQTKPIIQSNHPIEPQQQPPAHDTTTTKGSQSQAAAQPHDSNYHKVIYTVNYPAAPKTTSSRSLSHSQLQDTIVQPPILPPITQPMHPVTPSIAANSSQQPQLISNNRSTTSPGLVVTRLEAAPPSDDKTSTTINNNRPTQAPIPPTPVAPIEQESTTAAPRTTTSTTTTSPVAPTRPYVPETTNRDGQSNLEEPTIVSRSPDESNDYDKGHNGNQVPGGHQSNGSRLPPPTTSGSDSDTGEIVSSRSHRKNTHLSTTPPSPMNWPDPDNKPQPTKHELGDPGHIGPGQVAVADLTQVLPARKRRVQADLPLSLPEVTRQPATVERNGTPASWPNKDSSSASAPTTPKYQQQTTTRPHQPASQSTKRKTAFKPVMTSRHINLTINENKSISKDTEYKKPPINKDENSIDSTSKRAASNKIRDNPTNIQTQSVQRPAEVASNDKIPPVASKPLQQNQQPQVKNKVSSQNQRPFPSLETTEPAAWPSTVRGKSSTSTTIGLPSMEKNNREQAKKRRHQESDAPARTSDKPSSISNDVDEISNVIPVNRGRSKSSREQRAMQHDEPEASDQSQADSSSKDLDSNDQDKIQEPKETSAEPETEAEVDEFGGEAQADSLDSQLPPVPNYDEDNANSTADTEPTDSGDNSDNNPDSGEQGDNEEQLRQLSQSTRDSHRLSPVSQPLVSGSLNSTLASSGNIWSSSATNSDLPISDYATISQQPVIQPATSNTTIVVDYLHCIVGQFYILLGAILLNLWLDGLYFSKQPAASCQHESRIINNRSLMNKYDGLCASSGSDEPGSSPYAHLKHLKAKEPRTHDNLRISALEAARSWSSPSLASSSQTLNTDSTYAMQDDQHARFLLARHTSNSRSISRQASSSTSQHLTACSLFAGLCIVAGAIASTLMGVELISILTQCLTQLSTILACLIGLCLIWRHRNRYHHNKHRLEDHHQRSKLTNGALSAMAAASSTKRRLWQHKSSLYLEPPSSLKSHQWWLINNRHRRASTVVVCSDTLNTNCSKKTSGRQCFHYLFLLAAYYTGVSVALNLGNQFSLQQVFSHQVIQFISSHQQQTLDHQHLTPTNPVSINHFNQLFHCVLALKGLLLILQVTIQTVLIRCSCKSVASGRLRHIYTFLMFANLSLWAMEICSSQKQLTSSSFMSRASSQLLVPSLPTTSPVVNDTIPINNNPTSGQPHFMSLEAFINFASSIVTLSHLYHGLIFM